MQSFLFLVMGVLVGTSIAVLWFYGVSARQIRLRQDIYWQQSKHEWEQNTQMQIQQLEQNYQQQLHELQLSHQQAIEIAKKRSVNTSRAVIKGKMAEQFAPFSADFHYLPSDAKFLGDPVDYVIFSGYSEFREDILDEDDIEIVFVDIKSGKARLSKGQQAIANAIRAGRVRFETVKYDIEDEY